MMTEAAQIRRTITSITTKIIVLSVSLSGSSSTMIIGSTVGSGQMKYASESSIEFSGSRMARLPIFHISWQLMHDVCIRSVVPCLGRQAVQRSVDGSR